MSYTFQSSSVVATTIRCHHCYPTISRLISQLFFYVVICFDCYIYSILFGIAKGTFAGNVFLFMRHGDTWSDIFFWRDHLTKMSFFFSLFLFLLKGALQDARTCLDLRNIVR